MIYVNILCYLLQEIITFISFLAMKYQTLWRQRQRTASKIWKKHVHPPPSKNCNEQKRWIWNLFHSWYKIFVIFLKILSQSWIEKGSIHSLQTWCIILYRKVRYNHLYIKEFIDRNAKVYGFTNALSKQFPLFTRWI